MSLNIVFGSVKPTRSNASAEQQFDYPVVTIEASRGAGTSRRVLFNQSAAKLMSLETGSLQEILFGFSQGEEIDGNRLFVVNTANFTHEVDGKTYKTSKNPVAYDGETTEKGKGISSSPLVKELTAHMSVETDAETNFAISVFQEEGVDGAEATVYELAITDGTPPQPVEEIETESETVISEEATRDSGDEDDAGDESAYANAETEEAVGMLVQKRLLRVDQEGQQLHIFPPIFRSFVTTVPDVE